MSLPKEAKWSILAGEVGPARSEEWDGVVDGKPSILGKARACRTC